MMSDPIRNDNPGLLFLLRLWQKHCRLEDWHIAWAKQHILVLNKLQKEQTLLLAGEKAKNVYLVMQGMLARVDYKGKDSKRRILDLALPGMAFITTPHLYNPKPSTGDIIVLRSKTTVIKISYKSILALKEQEPQTNTIIHLLGTKRDKLREAVLQVLREGNSLSRYLLFAESMPELQRLLTQAEQAQLLNISRNTVQRGQYFLLTGKLPDY